MKYLGAISSMTGWSWFHFQGKQFNTTVIQVYALTTDVKEAEIGKFYGDLEDLLELTPKKKMIYSSLEIGMQK